MLACILTWTKAAFNHLSMNKKVTRECHVANAQRSGIPYFGCFAMQLTERRSGNDHYKQCRFVKALKHYERALSIVELVQGMSQADQAEIDTNRQTVLLNMAAVHLALERHGQAVTLCSRVIEADPTSIKALLRRAKALASRHEYQVGP